MGENKGVLYLFGREKSTMSPYFVPDLNGMILSRFVRKSPAKNFHLLGHQQIKRTPRMLYGKPNRFVHR